MPKDGKKFVEKAQGAVTQEFDDEEAKKILTATRILDDSDEELEKEDEKNRAEWANLVAANKRQDAEESRTSDVVKDIYFRKDRKEQTQEKIRMEPFNMRLEREEGYFDEFSVYHQNKKDDSDDEFQRMLNDDQHDLEKVQDKKLYEKHLEKYQKEHEAFEQTKEQPQEDVLAIYEEIFPILENKETISMALARVGKTKRKRTKQGGPPKKKKKKKHRRAWEVESDEDMNDEPEESAEDIAKRKEQFDILSDRATRLTTIGDYGIYDVGKAELYRRIAMIKAQKRELAKRMEAQKKKEAAEAAAKEEESSSSGEDEDEESEDEDFANAAKAPAGCAPKPPTEDADGNALYEYRFRAGDQKIHGPFPLPKLKGWNQQGFFLKRTICFRRVGEVEWKDSTVVDIANL